jgi:N utilization substance protein A
MAVWSNDPDVDPVGACVGVNGSRVNSIVDELHGEKIDIINWSDNSAELIENALSPAKVICVLADDEDKTAQVVVPDYQLSLAIGKSGQNVRLAAKLCNWKIDIKSHTQYYGDDEEVYEDEYEESYEEAPAEEAVTEEAPAEEMESEDAEAPEETPSEEEAAEEEE